MHLSTPLTPILTSFSRVAYNALDLERNKGREAPLFGEETAACRRTSGKNFSFWHSGLVEYIGKRYTTKNSDPCWEGTLWQESF